MVIPLLRVLGGLAGLAIGGRVGAAAFGGLGGALGLLTRAMQQALRAGQDASYNTAIVALSARLARCDGPVNRDEIEAFKAQFAVPPDQLREIGRQFDEARDGTIDPIFYAHALRAAFTGPQAGVLQHVYSALIAIARADGPVNATEAAFLKRIKEGLGLNQPQAALPDDPYAVLGLSSSAPDAVVRAKWRALVRENHPDAVAGRGVAPEIAARAGQLAARVNAAWDQIKRERNL